MVEDPYIEREIAKYGEPIPSREFISSHLAHQRVPMTHDALCQAFCLTTEMQQEALRRRLRAMERDGQLIFTRRRCYVLPELLEMVRGLVVGHREGYGFLQVSGIKEDLYLSVEQMKRALHGDFVLAQALYPDRRGRREARIVRVLEPRSATIVGRYFTEAGLGVVVPDDYRLNFDILIPAEECNTVRMGQVVVVALKQRPTHRTQAIGTLVEILGEHLAPGLETEIAIRNHNIPAQWSEAVVEQVDALVKQPVTKSEWSKRVDLTQLALVTIDGEDAHDFDDAVYCEYETGGWRLWVAIADVSTYVPLGTPLDEEAQRRGNSVYFPTQVVPMLPEVLSNDLCSLIPLVERPCLVCEMVISMHGQLMHYQFYPAVIKSQVRLTYNKVAHILAGDKTLNQRYAAVVPHLQQLHRLFLVLHAARERRGGLEFVTQETRFIFNSQRRIEQVVPLVRNDAHRMVEEFMILANCAAAQFMQQHRAPILYRVHEAPDRERLEAFRHFLGELGLSLGGGKKPLPKHYAQLIRRVSTRPDSELIQAMLLRSMQPALYRAENQGHFGLALTAYSHFTSPIRRYPDLHLHRVIKALLQAQQDDPQSEVSAVLLPWADQEALTALGEHCSMTERRADEATRDVCDWLKCEFMQDHVNEEFRGIISGVTSFGFFVRLDQLAIDGLVHVTTLENDYYHFDALSQRLIGRTFGKRYQLGDCVQVKVVAVHLDARKIELELIGSSQQKQHLQQGKGAVDKESNGCELSKRHGEGKQGAKKRGSTYGKRGVRSRTKLSKGKRSALQQQPNVHE